MRDDLGCLFRMDVTCHGIGAETDHNERGRVLLTTLTREFFCPRFPERDEGYRAEPCDRYPWDGVRDLGLLTQLKDTVAVGVY